MDPFSKVSILRIVLIDLLVFACLYLAYNKWRATGQSMCSPLFVALYFCQLFIVVSFAPLQLEEVVIYLSGYERNNIEIAPIVQGRKDNKGAKKLGINAAHNKKYVRLNLLYYIDKPRVFNLSFGDKPEAFDIIGIDLFTRFLSNRIPLVQVPGRSVGLFLKAPSAKINSVEQAEVLHNRPHSSITPSQLTFRLTDELVKYKVWHLVLWRALLWSIIATTLVGLVVLFPVSAKMARLYTSGADRSWNTTLAYYYWSTAVVCVFVVIAVLLSELGIRFYYRNAATSSGFNYYAKEANNMYARERNVHKLRGNHFTFKRHEEYRIAVMGDSFTYGQGVYPYTLRFSDLIEKKLNTLYPGTALEVLNLGISGHNVPEHIRFLGFVRALEPNFIIYQWFVNDMDVAGQRNRRVAPPVLNNGYWHSKLTDKWALYFLLQQGWQHLYILLGKIKSYDRDYIDLYSNEDVVFAKQSTARFIELLDGIKNIGVPYGIVLFPHSGYPIKSNPFNFMHRRVLDICDKRNIPCLDLREAYAPFDDQVENLWASKFDQHPNAMAHNIAADRIFEFFAPTWREHIAKRQQTN